jgi:hypothetical protein
MALAYNARNREEVDAVLAQAKAAGAKLLKPATEAFWGGYFGCFYDPDGFVWEVMWNPSFPIDADGSTRIPDSFVRHRLTTISVCWILLSRSRRTTWKRGCTICLRGL